MTHDEFMDLDPQAAADKLNALMAEGKTQDEAAAEFELTKPDLLKLNVFFVKDKYIAWPGRQLQGHQAGELSFKQ